MLSRYIDINILERIILFYSQPKKPKRAQPIMRLQRMAKMLTFKSDGCICRTHLGRCMCQVVRSRYNKPASVTRLNLLSATAVPAASSAQQQQQSYNKQKYNTRIQLNQVCKFIEGIIIGQDGGGGRGWVGWI